MKQDVQNNNENIPLNNNDNDNNNDNVSLKNHACLQAIPYEVALQQIGWGELKPISSALLPVVPFHPAQVPTALGRYIYDIADHQQSPVDFVAVSALCGLAALIGNGIRIAPKQHSNDWKIVPNLWGAIIGNPSALKTPAMQAALTPIAHLQKEWYQEWKKQKKRAKIEEILEELNQKEKKKQASKALKKGDSEAARALLSETLSKNNEKDDCISRFIVNDTTVEKLGELLNENPRGLLMIRDELSGFLTNMERREYQTDRAFYLEAFNGDGYFFYDRIGRGTIYISNATLSIIGTIQPTRILHFIRHALYGKGDDGFLQRFQMIVWPDENQEWKWKDRPPLKDAYKDYEEVFRSFRDKPLGSPEHPIVMRFSPDAQELFREWWEKLHREIRRNDLSESLQAYLLKMPKTIPTLALIFELVEGGRFEITLPSLKTALRWENYLLSHVKRLYAAGNASVQGCAKLIVKRCDCLPDIFTLRDIHQRHWTDLTEHSIIQKALELLCRSNHIREISGTKNPTGGRPTIRYEWHPLIKNKNTRQ